jgi:aryl-alcohol dehydrogenase-like predicted oxidoreductase
MSYLSIPGIDMPVSRVAMGTVSFSPDDYPRAAELLDAFLERGGTAVDTAHVYGRGASERVLGRWLTESRQRSKIVLIDKGCHPIGDSGPRVSPELIHADLAESLDRLRTDSIDLYLLHRDDEQVPVGLLVEALNAEREAGRIRAFGGSNWRVERIAEANAYAEAHGLVGFAVSSPNLSLARPNVPVWPGCLSVRDADKAWHAANQFPLVSWSSQARGFLSGQFLPTDTRDAEMVRVWYSDANFERLNHAIELGQRRGVGPIAIALAYVLNQPFPTVALVGPATVAELDESLQALDIELTAEDLAFLDLA